MIAGGENPEPNTVARLHRIVAGQLAQANTDPGLYRASIKHGTDFIHQQFEKGATASMLISLRTSMVDQILSHSWGLRSPFFDQMALLAVGGYGRAELHPFSDIDIAIILPPAATGDERGNSSQQEDRISEWITSLWDLNLDIGHSVRTIVDCEQQANADITVITNLMEARLICGNLELFHTMQTRISTDRMWRSEQFFQAKLDEQAQRRQRFQTNAYRLEPNIKESQGGLRDFQTIAWVCQRQFGTRDLDPLVNRGLLEPPELDSLREGLELLWRIRYLLHHFAGRREDRLLFDYQKDIAHSFGYTDDTGNKSIEQLMQRFYRTVMSLQRLNEILLQGIGGIISGVTAASAVEVVNSRFHIRNGFLEVRHEDVFLHYPPALLELFLLFGTLEKATNVRSNTVRLIRSHLHLINDRFRSDSVVRNLFIQIFCIPDKLTRTVRLMNRYGVLAAYLPAFDKIVGRMQYDLFHIYTVDEHTIGVIRNLRRLMVDRFEGELPHGSKIAGTIQRHHVLYLTALFHDIAKGRGGDHSELGAVEAREFAQWHGMNREDASLFEWTVRHHLLMSLTAQRKDIDDPGVQLEFARMVGDTERLNHLYLLTISDIRATNPELWNSFKQTLLESLHTHCLKILQRGLDNPLEPEDVISRRQQRTLTMIDSKLTDGTRVTALWKKLGADYFKQYQAVEIARHTETLLSHEPDTSPLVALSFAANRGATELLIYTPDNEALFALISTVLERLQLNVLSATITTTVAGYALDTFNVLTNDNLPVDDSMQVRMVKETLVRELEAPRDIPALGAQRPSRRLKYFSVPTQIQFAEHESGLTEVRISAADRPGLLSDIGQLFLSARTNVHAARIATLGERIDDVFVLSNHQGHYLSDEEQKHLKDLLENEI
ncbi:MAG: [protein-PII] uridylyltransferase [Granulosicoccus sp.]